MEYEKMQRICVESLRIKRKANIYEACIHIVGCYGMREEWITLRQLYFRPKTMSNVWAFSSIYNSACAKIASKFGHLAWQSTLAFSTAD